MITELINKVELWSIEKGIKEKGTRYAQALKVMEEASETLLAVGKGDNAEVMDGIGDTMVTLIILAQLHEVTLEDCLSLAYKEIKDRKGRMINGTFVKETK